jgi:hypothetical protein
VSTPPEFRDLVGDDLSPEERARLERVHEMLIAAGPPPELPPELAEVPTERRAAEPTGLPRRRAGAALALAAAIALVAFVGGYIAGHSRSSPFEAVRSVKLANSEASAVVRFGPEDENGNTPMLVKVEGLPKLPANDYYTLFMTKKGKPVAVCGSFNVSGPQSTTVRFPVAYEPDEFDGLQLSRYHHQTHKMVPVASAEL